MGGPGSAVSFHHVAGELHEPVGGRAKRGQGPASLLTQTPGSLAALLDAQQSGIRQFTANGVFLHSLSRLLHGALDVQQVVRDLEGLPEALAVLVETSQQVSAPNVG